MDTQVLPLQWEPPKKCMQQAQVRRVTSPFSTPCQPASGPQSRTKVRYVVQGFRAGFDIGFRGIPTNTRPKNLKSAAENREGVGKAIEKELKNEHTAGPFTKPSFEVTHVSPIGAVPKPGGSTRLILDKDMKAIKAKGHEGQNNRSH